MTTEVNNRIPYSRGIISREARAVVNQESELLRRVGKPYDKSPPYRNPFPSPDDQSQANHESKEESLPPLHPVDKTYQVNKKYSSNITLSEPMKFEKT